MLVELLADGMVFGERGARIFHVFFSDVLLGTPLVTVVSKLLVVLSTVKAVWGLGHLNLCMVFVLEHVSQDETRGTAVTVFFLAVRFAARSDRFQRTSSKAICKLSHVCCANSPASAVLPS